MTAIDGHHFPDREALSFVNLYGSVSNRGQFGAISPHRPSTDAHLSLLGNSLFLVAHVV
jgi:hypothetical protein